MFVSFILGMTPSHGQIAFNMMIWTLPNPLLRELLHPIHVSAQIVPKWIDQRNKCVVWKSPCGKTCTIPEVKSTDNIDLYMSPAFILLSKLVKLAGDFKCILDCPNFQNICNVDHFG